MVSRSRSLYAVQLVASLTMSVWLVSSSVDFQITTCDAFSIPQPERNTRRIRHPSDLATSQVFPLKVSVSSSHQVLMNSKESLSELRPCDLLPARHNNTSLRDMSSSVNITLADPTKRKVNAKKKNAAFVADMKPRMPLLLPWSLWMHARSDIHSSVRGNSQFKSSNSNRKKRRWEIPLTSKPFQGFEFLRSTVVYCVAAIAIYFLMGTFVFSQFLEPNWSVIDSLYFSMTTLTTVGYGDLVASSRGGSIGKLFLLFFNIYAVCISVSALSVIAKLALSHQKNLLMKAKERARNQLIKIFDAEEDDEDEYDAEEDDEDDEQCRWIDNILDDKCVADDRPLSILSVLYRAIKNHSFNFVVLMIMAAVLQRIEKWSLIDILYYWNSTATTIGFGDVSPRTQLGRLIAVIFVPLSVVTLGEVIANCFAFITSRASAKAEKDFLRREITLTDLEYLDINDDGKVCEMDFVTFMLVAMQKIDKKTMTDLKRLFKALDVGKDGYIQKEDLITLRQRKRLAKRLRREAKRNKQSWYL
jgi:potassium channel subfamily K